MKLIDSKAPALYDAPKQANSRERQDDPVEYLLGAVFRRLARRVASPAVLRLGNAATFITKPVLTGLVSFSC
jgi:hypothetical protein